MDIQKLLDAEKVDVSILDSGKVNGEFVKVFRKKNKLSRIELANILGVTEKTIENWEKGTHKVNGSSKMLLTLLDNNPNLIDLIYKVEK